VVLNPYDDAENHGDGDELFGIVPENEWEELGYLIDCD
jgi:hypothetical protein